MADSLSPGTGMANCGAGDQWNAPPLAESAIYERFAPRCQAEDWKNAGVRGRLEIRYTRRTQ